MKIARHTRTAVFVIYCKLRDILKYVFYRTDVKSILMPGTLDGARQEFNYAQIEPQEQDVSLISPPLE